MSTKYRCPACGATHKEDVASCRLCGHSMDPTKTTTGIPAPTARVATSNKSGTKGMVLLGLGIVVVIVVGAVALGLVRRDKAIDQAVNKLGIGGTTADGWTAIPDDKATQLGFTVALPGDRTLETIPFPGAESGKLTGFSASIGKDYELFAGSGTITLPATTNSSTKVTDLDTVKQIAQLSCVQTTKTDSGTTSCVRYKTGDGSDATKVTEVKNWGNGVTAISVTAQSGKMNGQDAFTNTLYALRKDPANPTQAKIYVVQVKATTTATDVFDHAVGSFSPV